MPEFQFLEKTGIAMAPAGYFGFCWFFRYLRIGYFCLNSFAMSFHRRRAAPARDRRVKPAKTERETERERYSLFHRVRDFEWRLAANSPMPLYAYFLEIFALVLYNGLLEMVRHAAKKREREWERKTEKSKRERERVVVRLS